MKKVLLLKENLPGKVTNELLKKHFESKFGKVCYISMPKYKTSHQLKGFAFVEFEEVECAKKAYKVKLLDIIISSMKFKYAAFFIAV